MQDNHIRKIYRNIIIVFVIIIITILIVFFAIVPTIQYLSRPAFLDILVAPVDATIVIDDNRFYNAIYEMEPQHYTATISREGFESAVVELDLEKNKTTGLYLYLQPLENDWSFYEQKENQPSLDALLRLNGFNSDGEEWQPVSQLSQKNDSVEKIIGKFTIKSIMPMNISICGEPATRMNCDAAHIEYQYSKKCEDRLCLIITGRSANLTDEMLNEIKNKFNQSGYNFNNYQYIYFQDATR